MKRIVTFLVPVREGNNNGLNSPDGHSAPPQDDRDPAPANQAGSMRVEVVVSDELADRVINTLLGHPDDEDKTLAAAPSDDPVKALVYQELRHRGAGHADSLLERIIARVERHLILQVYDDCNRVKSRAALRLGINRNTLLKKLRQYNSLPEDADDTDELEMNSHVTDEAR